MNIKQKMILNDLAVGIIPVVLAFVILAIVFSIQSNSDIIDNLDRTTSKLKVRIENDMDNYRNYSYLFARSLQARTYSQLTSLSRYQININVRMFNIKLMEFSYKSRIAHRDAEKAEYCAYWTSDKMAATIWEFIDNPLNNEAFKASFSDICSNTLVIRNASCIYDYDAAEKIGLSILSFPVDEDYLQNITRDFPDLISFLETSNGVIYSQEITNQGGLERKIHDQALSDERREFSVIDIAGQGRYYLYKTQLFMVKDQVIATLGILYGFSSVNKTVNLFYLIGTGIFLFSVLTASVIALLIAGRLTGSILKLKDLVIDFKNQFKVIQPPPLVRDEIDLLQSSFSDMSRRIMEYNENMLVFTRNLNETNASLSRAQSLIQRELDIARNIQTAIIPKTFPGSEGIAFSGAYQPMEILGGDYYDVFPISSDRIGIVIADVSGHGVPSALITTMVKISFSSLSLHRLTTGETVDRVNREIFNTIGEIEDAPFVFYLTAFYGIIDLKAMSLEYTSAGHTDVYLAHPDGAIRALPSNSLVIGAIENTEFATQKAPIGRGDRLVLVTDGLTEARNRAKELFGEERILKIIEDMRDRPLQELTDRLMEDVNRFRIGMPAFDDITILNVEILAEKRKKGRGPK